MKSHTTKLKILLFGGSGLIGSRLRELLEDKYQIIAPPRNLVDVTNRAIVESTIEKVKPNYIVYTAGLTSIDDAEQNPKLAYLLNAHVPHLIAKKAAAAGTPLFYFSTDAVFDGAKSDSPYTENDRENPLSVYGKTKLSGEQQVYNTSSRNCIIRIIMVYSHAFFKRKRFVQIALDTLKKGEKFYALTDQIINPVYVDDIIAAVDILIESKSSGIYHLGAVNYVTNFEFVKKIAKHFTLNEELVTAMSFEDFFKNRGGLRTKFCWLDTSKFRMKIRDGILHTIDESIMLFKKNLEKS